MKKLLAKIKYALGKAASRKGMGMELALLVLFVVMACSILLVSSAMVGKDNLNTRKEQMLQRIELEQIAEAAVKSDSRENSTVENYSLHWDGDTLTISDKEENVLLTVTITGDKITYWQYS